MDALCHVGVVGVVKRMEISLQLFLSQDKSVCRFNSQQFYGIRHFLGDQFFDGTLRGKFSGMKETRI